MRILPTILAIIVAALVSTATAAETVTLRMGTNDHLANPPKVGGQIAFQWLQKEIEERTAGEVDLQIYWGAQLGPEKELVRMLPQGSVDVSPVTPGNLAGLVPEVGLFSTSYLFRGYDHYYDVVADPEFFRRLQEIVEKKDLGLQLVGIGLTGTRNFYNRERPVEQIADLEGLKMRVMASPIEHEVWSTLGTLPTNIPSTEIYTSIQTGVVDAAESSLPYIVGNKYYEVAPYVTLTNHQFSVHLYLMSDLALQKIPSRHVPVVKSAFREAGLRHIRATEKLSKEKLAELKEKPGATVTEIDTEPMAEKLARIQDEVAKELGVEDLLQMIRAH
jgi:tripartite ATP-independent transporter DctP family solute receptor